MKVKRKRRMSRRRREQTYIAVMVLLAIAVSIGLTRSVMRDDKEFEEYEQQSQEFNARMQRIDEKREASGQNAMLEQVRTWQQEQDTEPDKYAVFDTMSADWGGEEDGFVFYEIPDRMTIITNLVEFISGFFLNQSDHKVISDPVLLADAICIYLHLFRKIATCSTVFLRYLIEHESILLASPVCRHGW